MPFFANNVPVIGSPPGTMMQGRQSREESRGLPSGLKMATSGNFSRGSSHISDKSSKGRMYMKPPSVIQPAAFHRNLPNLPEVPEVRGMRDFRLPNMRDPSAIGINPIAQNMKSPYVDEQYSRKSPIGLGNVPAPYKAPGKISNSMITPSFLSKAGAGPSAMGRQ
jgi:hypothetical protein